MQVSVTISGLSRLFGGRLRGLLDVARAADGSGIDQLVLSDHVAIGPRLDRYPFADRFPYPPEEPWLEPLTALAAIAGATERVRLGTGVLVAPLRPAVLLAKTAATLDVLSGGRLDLGVGTGWQPEEFDAVGASFSGRGARMDDALRACRALWTDDPPVSFTSPTVSFRQLWLEPRPVQPGGPPLWFGGGPTTRTAARIAELGTGWLPLAISDEQLASGITLVHDAFRRAGRDPDGIGVRAGVALVRGGDGAPDLGATRARADELAALGVTTVSVALGRFLREPADIPPFLESLGGAFT